MRIDGEIHLRQPREMAHHLQFGYLGQRGRHGAAQMLGNFGGARDPRRVLRDGAASRLAQFEYQRFSRLQISHGRCSFKPRRVTDS